MYGEETMIGTTTEVEQLRQENQQLRERYAKKANSRIEFRNQVLRELVTPPHKEQQQHLAKMSSAGPWHEATDTFADTVFQRLGEAIRAVVDDGGGETSHRSSIRDMFHFYEELRQRAESTEKIIWCKACGEHQPDCRCKVPKPRQG